MEFAKNRDSRSSLSLTGWTESYLKAVFGDSFDKVDFELSVDLYQRFLSSYRERVSFHRRCLALLNPLSSLRNSR